MTLLEELNKDLKTSGDRNLAKAVRKILAKAEERPLEASGAKGRVTVPALWFDVQAFAGGPLTLALHHTLAEGEGGTWAITEPRSGLACTQAEFEVIEAIKTALWKCATSIAADGREGFEKRVMAQVPPLQQCTSGDKP